MGLLSLDLYLAWKGMVGKPNRPSSGSVPRPSDDSCWRNLETLGSSSVYLGEPMETHRPGLGGSEEGRESCLETHCCPWEKGMLIMAPEYVNNGTTHSLGEQMLKAKQIPKAGQFVSLGQVSSGKR